MNEVCLEFEKVSVVNVGAPVPLSKLPAPPVRSTRKLSVEAEPRETEMLVGIEVTTKVSCRDEVIASLTLNVYVSGSEAEKHAAESKGKKYSTVMSTSPMATPVTETSPAWVTGSIIM
jgi:hypothetical protein